MQAPTKTTPTIVLIIFGFLLLFSYGGVQAQNICNEIICDSLSFNAGPVGGNVICEDDQFSLSVGDFTLGGLPVAPDSVRIYWGDGQSSLVFQEGVYNHTYTFEENELLNNGACPANGSEGLLIYVIAYKNCPAGQSCVTIIPTLTLRYRPIVRFTIPDTLCQNEPLCLSNNSCFVQNYLIDYGDGTTGTDPSICHDYPSVPGVTTYTVTMEGTNQCGGMATLSQQVTIIPPPDAQIGLPLTLQNDDTACAGDLTFTNQSDTSPFTLTTAYYWEVYQNGVLQAPIDTLYDESPFTHNFTPGDYEVVLIGENSYCDTMQSVAIFTVDPSPSADITEPGVICTSDFTSYTPIVSYTNDNLITSYSWTFENGTPSTSSVANPSGITFPSGTHDITLVLGSDCGNSNFSTTITIQDPSIITFPPLDSYYCANTDTIDITPSVLGGTWSSHPAILGDTAFAIAQATAGQLHTLTYSLGGCTAPTSIDINILPPTPTTITPADSTICSDAGSFTFTASEPGGTWSGDGIDANTGLFDPSLSIGGNLEITYTFTDVDGCENSATTNLIIEALPTASLNTDTLFFCEAPGNINLNTELNLSLPPTFTSEWLGSCVDAAGILDPVCVGVDTIGLQYVVASPTPCTDTTSITIIILPYEQVVVGQDTTICVSPGETFTLVTPSIPGGQWSGTNVDSNTGIISMDASLDGSYTYTYTVFPGTNCSSSDEVVVDIINLTGVTAPDFSFCETETLVQLPDGMPSGGIWFYEGDSIPGGMLDVQSLGAGNHSLQYQVESPAADQVCQAVADADVFVDALPSIDVEVPQEWCINEPQTLSNNTPFTYTSWSWDFGDGNTSAALAPQHTYANTGYYDITLVVQDTVCSDTFVWNGIHVSAPPPPLDFDMTLSATDSCETLVASFVNTSTVDTNITNLVYIWDFGFNGFSDTTYSIGEIPMDIPYEAFADDTIYHITLTAQSSCGEATSIGRDSVYVKPKPISAFGSQYEIYCSGSEVLFINSSVGNPDNTIIDLGDGSPLVFDYPSDTLIHTYWVGNEPDTFYVTFISTNECGADTIRDTLQIIPVEVVANFTTQGSGTFCVGLPVCVESNATPGAAVYYDFGDGQLYYAEDTCHTYTAPGNYVITQYASDICGGFDTLQTPVTVIDAPPVGMAFPSSNCVGADISFTGIADTTVFNATWDFGDGNSSNALTPVHSYAAPGTYVVTFTVYSLQGCYSDTLSSMTILPAPEPVLGFSDSLCVGESALLENLSGGNTSSCLWTIDGAIHLPTCNTSYDFTQSGTHTLRLQITDPNGCIAAKDTAIYIRPTPTAQFNVQTLEACHPSSFSFSEASMEANTATWDFGDGTPLAQGDSLTHTFSLPGDYDVTLYASFDGICWDTTMQTITAQLRPEAIIQADVASGCEPFIPQLQNLSLGNHLEFEWQVPADSFTSYSPVLGHALYSDAVSTDYDIILIATDSITQCSDTTMITATAFDSLQLTLSQDPVGCFAASDGQATVIVTGGLPNYQYNWSNGSVADTTGLVVAGLYSVTVVDGNGCTDSDTIAIASPSPILANETITPVNCLGETNGAISLSPTGGTGAYQYNWDSAGNLSAINNLSAGDYNLTLTDTNGCSSTFTFNVPTAHVFPIASMVIDQTSGCEPFSPILTFTGQGSNLDIIWDLGDGNIEYDSTSIQPVFTTNAPESTYQIVLSVEDDSTGCSDSDTLSVTVYDQLFAHIQYTPIPCHDDSTLLQANVSGGNGVYDYDWTPNLGNTASIHAPAGNYALSVSDANGCSASIDTVITHPSPIVIALDSSSNASCEGLEDAYLEIAVSGGTTVTGSEYTYTWNADDATPGGPGLTSVDGGTYIVTVTDQNGCTALDTFVLLSGEKLLANVVIQGITCEADTDGRISVQGMVNGLPPYEGSIEGPAEGFLVSNSGSMNFSDLPQGQYQLMVLDSNGCVFEDLVNVPGWVDPVVSILPDTSSIYLCQDLNLRASYLASGLPADISVRWSPDVRISCLDCDTVTVSPRRNETYYVNVTDEHGCTATAEKSLEVERDETFYVPNTFTPNGDGLNDIFRIRVGRQQEYFLESITMFNVLDQWGNVLYTAPDHHPLEAPDVGWDGRISGVDVPPGRYMYVVEYLDCEGDRTIIKGAVDLIR